MITAAPIETKNPPTTESHDHGHTDRDHDSTDNTVTWSRPHQSGPRIHRQHSHMITATPVRIMNPPTTQSRDHGRTNRDQESTDNTVTWSQPHQSGSWIHQQHSHMIMAAPIRIMNPLTTQSRDHSHTSQDHESANNTVTWSQPHQSGSWIHRQHSHVVMTSRHEILGQNPQHWDRKCRNTTLTSNT